MKLIIQVPCFNEEATLGLTLYELPRQPGFLSNERWFKDVGPTAEIEQSLQRGEKPALLQLVERCKIWEDEKNIILDTHMIERATASGGKQ